MKLNDDMLTNAIKNGLLDEFERPQSNHTQNPNKMAIRKMDKKQIEKNSVETIFLLASEEETS